MHFSNCILAVLVVSLFQFFVVRRSPVCAVGSWARLCCSARAPFCASAPRPLSTRSRWTLPPAWNHASAAPLARACTLDAPVAAPRSCDVADLYLCIDLFAEPLSNVVWVPLVVFVPVRECQPHCAFTGGFRARPWSCLRLAVLPAPLVSSRAPLLRHRPLLLPFAPLRP